MKPKLLYSELTNNYYIVTKYKDVGNGDFDVREKHDVTDEVEAIIKKRCNELEAERDKLLKECEAANELIEALKRECRLGDEPFLQSLTMAAIEKHFKIRQERLGG